jgi:hypothetical protein
MGPERDGYGNELGWKKLGFLVEIEMNWVSKNPVS